MYTTLIDDMDFCDQADELPRRHPGLQDASPTPTVTCLSAWASWALYTAMSCRGALHGLMRVRCFTQDDAHIFMTPEQMKDEIIGVISLIDSVYSVFGFEYDLELSTTSRGLAWAAMRTGSAATNALREAMERAGP